MDKPEITELNFEQAYGRLEETVQKLEAGQLPLADALTLYEQGMALAQYCQQQLEQAELTIKQLSPEGELAEFDEN